MPSTVVTLGLIVNPVAGMGGSVGLKGTDGELYAKALRLGADPVAPERTLEFLAHLQRSDRMAFLAAPAQMGAHYLRASNTASKALQVLGEIGDETTAADTRRIAGQMAARGAELLIFVGGDGTARDVHDAIDAKIPVVAVPAGVKVYSSVFALNSRAAAELVDAFVEGSSVTEEEVLDIDEEAFREDRLASRHYGYLLVPQVPKYLQHAKVASSGSRSVEEAKKEIAAYVAEEIDPKTLYLLGPGTTVKAIADKLGLPKTLLGIDAVRAGSLVGQDLNERAILDLLRRYDRRVIVVTPLGGNGFIFGRGNKPFTPEVIQRVGAENVLIIATRQKLRPLACLRVDTGDPSVDAMLTGWRTVIVGYHERRMVSVDM